MATPTPKQTSSDTRYPPRPPATALEIVDPRWLLKALGAAIMIAAVLGYLSVCFLIYQGGWQFLLHPSKEINRTPATLAIPFDPIRFDAAATGSPRLTAWWIPSSDPNHKTATVLFLHNGDGSLGSNVDQLALLHRAGLNIFAIDYRGFGKSDSQHPSEIRMTEDTAAALDYLINTRHLPPASIIPYGVGLGAALATSLIHSHSELRGIIIDNPDPDLSLRPMEGKSARFIPVRLLLRDHFELTSLLTSIVRPKLLITGGPADVAPRRDRANNVFFSTLPEPKTSVSLPTTHFDDLYVRAITDFIDATSLE